MTFVHGWTTHDMLNALREFADLVDPACGPVAYQAWARENHQPSMSLIKSRLGWRQAKTDAGVDLPKAERTYSAKFETWVRYTDEGLHWAINELLPRIRRSL